MADPILLALDFGGTKLSAAIANIGEREWSALKRVLTPPNKNAQYDMETMLELARQLLDGRIPAGIGVSFGGPVDARRGRVILSHHVPGWEDTPLREQLQETLQAPASIDNDANVAALGEYHFGAGVVGGRRVSSLLYVTVSTGVGGGWVLDGSIYGGADRMAGEIGHTVVDPRGPECICGRRGCVEIMACGPAIAREARARLTTEPQAGQRLLALVSNNIDAITGERVARAANEGDPLAREVMDKAAHALGWGIGTAITLMNPERVVVGGGVSKSGEWYFAGVRAAAWSNSLPQMRVDIVPAALGDDAPLWGAVALAEQLVDTA
ncbi:MAG TPA: ROK family protein [Anaerolineae bacterium]